MSARARQLAERCFALARSTTFAGERDAAIARGMVIAEKAGLSLDLFDIPGRVRAARTRPNYTHDRARFRREDEALRRHNATRPDRAPEQYSSADLREVMDRFRATMAAQEAAAGAGPDETVYDARRRNFAEATAAAAKRDAARSAR